MEEQEQLSEVESQEQLSEVESQEQLSEVESQEQLETLIAQLSETINENTNKNKPNYIYFVPKSLRQTGRYNQKRIKQRQDYRMKNV